MLRNAVPISGVAAVCLLLGAADKERTIEATLRTPPPPGLRIERVFGPELSYTGPYKHPASIAELAKGDLYIAWYGGLGEYASATSVWGTRLKRGAAHWTAPRQIAHDPLRSVGNAVVWQPRME